MVRQDGILFTPKDVREVPDLPTPRKLTAEGAIVKLLRSLRGWKQGELAKAAGTSQKLISSYEVGEKVPRPRTLERLAAVVGVPFFLVDRILPLIRQALAAVAGGPLLAADPWLGGDPPETAEDLARKISESVRAKLVPILEEAMIDLDL
jgi:transcriptional regulator with XRE-family HTH domain